jgi:DNA-binding transcriptional LysR family regulator
MENKRLKGGRKERYSVKERECWFLAEREGVFDMNNINLTCFLSSVRTKSFSLAAEHLSITHQAVSQNIHKLEEEMGCTLLIRNGQSLRLTRAGEEFFAWVNDFEEKLEWADELFYQEKECEQKLRIAFPHWMGLPESFLKRLEELRKEFPKVQVELLSGSVEEEAKLLTELKADLYLVPQRDILMKRANNLFLAPLKEEVPLRLVCPRSYLGPDRALYYRQLLRLPFLSCDLWETVNEEMKELYAALCHDHRMQVLPEKSCPNIRSVVSEIAMGNGFSFLSASYKVTEMSGDILLSEEMTKYEQAKIAMSCIWRMQTEADATLLWFVKGVCEL